jgi:hypothetical protein
MPQFDFTSFFVQIFWITVLIYTMHLVYLYLFLPKTGSVLKFREKINSKTNLFLSENSTKIWNKCLQISFKR